MNPISIGPLTFARPLFMAPMEGITDVPFRRIVREHGCGVTCTQMIHAEALLHWPERRVVETATIAREEGPVGLQLCSSSPSAIAKASKKAEEIGAAFVDLNMGCPAPSVVTRGAGAALLQDPAKAGEIVRAAVSSVAIPVTVKIRAGWDAKYLSALDVAEVVQREGAKLLTVHARTREQRFKGKADWELVRELKSRLAIPVVGNGDVFRPGDAERMLAVTGADGVMVARGALGNPWIFGGVRPRVREVRETLMRHLDYHLSFYENPDRALLMFRKQIVWYTKGLPDSADFRARLFRERSREKTIAMLSLFFDSLDPESFPGS
jgi:tRNA-dihydrouridine synthase B